MPSFTSNSEPHAPDAPWGKIWLLTLATCLVLVVGTELLVRSWYHPSVSDERNLWCYWRSSLAGAKQNTIVLVGTSRMHLDISLDVWRQQFPSRPLVQLAIEGGKTGPVLNDLAADPHFAGTVICDLTDVLTDRDEQRGGDSWVRYYQTGWERTRIVETVLEAFAQSHLAILNERISVISTLEKLARGRCVQPDLLDKHFDRGATEDFSQVCDLQAEADHWLSYLPKEAESDARLAERVHAAAQDFSRMVRQIEARGGRVIFVRLPTSGKLRAGENAFLPRAKVWDEFAKQVGIKTIHFEDVPSLRDYICPDDSHLDRKDTTRFTQALLAEFARQGLLARELQN